jgi:hypothetical protein
MKRGPEAAQTIATSVSELHLGRHAFDAHVSESALHSISFTRCASLGMLLSSSPHRTTRNSLRRAQRSKQESRLYLHYHATMAEANPYFKRYHECEELYKQAKYTECTKLALDNLMGIWLSFQICTEVY